jgi:hypothetical protein
MANMRTYKDAHGLISENLHSNPNQLDCYFWIMFHF